MTHPAVLYFGILFQHHVGVYLLGCGKTLGLDDFKVNGDFLPVIVQKLVCCIAVNQRNSCQPCKDLPAQAFFLAGSIQLRHAVDECGLQVGIKVTESILESGLERHHIRVVQNCVFQVLHIQTAIGFVVRAEQSRFQVRECCPVGRQVLQFGLGNAAKHRSVNVPALSLFGRVHIAGNVQVVIVLNDLRTGYSACELFDFLRAFLVSIHNAFDVAGTQLIVFAVLLKALRRINNQNVRILFILPQHHDDGGNACAEENIGGQTDDCINVVVVNQIFANCTFFTATE